MIRTSLLTLLLTTCLTSLWAQTPQLVKDINTAPAHANPDNKYVLNGVMYFTATDNQHGTEIWKTDGTTANTVLLKDVLEGPSSSSPTLFTSIGNTLLFNTQGGELWKSDGTEKGTEKITDVQLETPVEANGLLFFVLSDATSGKELWRTDGTASGTKLVKDINAGAPSSFPRELVAVGNTLYFTATTTNEGTELWKSDGTEAGTVLVKDIMAGTGNSSVRYLTAYNGQLYFTANDGTTGLELWTSDGTSTGTAVVSDIIAGTGGAFPTELTVSGSLLYFAASDVNGRELWKSDGTSLGTAMVEDLNPFGNTNPESLVDVNGKIFFIGDVDKGEELYVSDGTVAGTSFTRDLFPIQTDAFIRDMTAVGDTCFFVAHSSPNYQNFELHMSNGSGFGTKMVKDIIPGATASNPSDLVAFNGKLYFTVDDNIHGSELWISDGSSTGTKLFKDLNEGTLGSSISAIVSYKNGVAFTANAPASGQELWTSTGSEASTVLVDDLVSGTGSTFPENLTSGGDEVYFTVFPGRTSGELYRSDGTAAGTNYIRMTSFSDYASQLTFVNGILFFARRSSFNNELWAYTPSGSARLVRKIQPNGLGADVRNLTGMDGNLYFSADDGNDGGVELWTSDGSYAGTRRVKDIYSGYKDSNPSALTASGTKLYFTADDGSNGRELWVTDGTEANTLMLKVNPGASTSPTWLTAGDNGTLFFFADDGTNGTELWHTDGTVLGTKMVKDMVVGASGTTPSQMVFNNGKLYYSINDPATNLGNELWISDGTELGTKLLKDINKGTEGSDIESFTIVRNELYFVANDGTHGMELWKTDGTAKGTQLVDDLYSGSIGSTPQYLTLHNDTLYFAANTAKTGTELHFLFTNCLAPNFESSSSCIKDTAKFTNLSNTLGKDSVTYQWLFGSVDGGTQFEPKMAFDTARVYTVTLKMNRPGCDAEITKTHEVLGLPIPDFTIDNDTQCVRGNSFALTNGTVEDGKSYGYTWEFSDGSTNSSKDATKSFTTPGTHTIKLVAKYKGCKGEVEQEVTTLAGPAKPTISGKTSTETETDDYSVANNAGSTYAWEIIHGTQTSGGSTNEITVEWDASFTNGRVKVIETNADGCSSNEADLQVSLNISSSIDDAELNTIELYPNPTSGEVTISMDGVTSAQNITLYDELGREVYSSQWQASTSLKTIDVKHLAAGTYRMVIRGDLTIRTSLIVVQH